MALKLPVKSHSLELALHSWFNWVDSIRVTREQLSWKREFSPEEWEDWSKGLDKDSVWVKALTAMDELKLPRLFAGYWVACLISRYDSEDISSFINIEYPDWTLVRLHELVDTLLYQKLPFGHEISNGVISGQDISEGFSKRALPPSYVAFMLPGSASFVTLHIPLFMLPGLVSDPSPLQELMKEIVDQYGKHPISQLLKHVGRSVGWEWERRKIKEVRDDQLRTLYNYLMQYEYYREILESFSEKELKKAAKSLDVGTRDELLMAYKLEVMVSQSERRKIKGNVRKRVSGWFKSAGRWPLPEE